MPQTKTKRYKRKKRTGAKKSGHPWGIDEEKYAAARATGEKTANARRVSGAMY